MGGKFYNPGEFSGFQYDSRYSRAKDNDNGNGLDIGRSRGDEDLIIEDNTVYEIDRECYERLKRQRMRREK